MNRLETEQKILHYSRQIPDEALLEVLHYLEFLEQKTTSQNNKLHKRFNTAKVKQIAITSRENLHER